MTSAVTRRARVAFVPVLTLTTLAVLVAGCAVQPTPLTQDAIAKRVADDKSRMYADQEAIAGPVSFHEAAARALKYNLDYRLKLMEGALAQGLLDVSRFDMFPKLLANAGYSWRGNDLATRADQVVPNRTPFLPFNTSTDNSRLYSDLTLSWNILDFGVSYYRAKQQADQVLVAEERRRKVMQNVLQDTRTAYWRALGAQRLLPQMDALTARADEALSRARQIEEQGLLPQPQALAYQRALLDATTLIQVRRQDLELAKAELGALMTTPPGTSFTLADEKEEALPPVPTNLEDLETAALNSRPELREEDYRKRITSLDIRKAMVSALPGISFDFGANYDGNRYLLNDTWVQGGARISMNLFRLASLPTLKRANEAQQQVDDARRLALSMAVMTQTRLAVQRYGLAVADLRQSDEGAKVDERLLQYARAAVSSKVDSELEVIRNEARVLLSQYQRYVAYANAQAAWGRVYNSVGLDVLPRDVENADVKALAGTLERTMREWESQTFRAKTGLLPAMQPVALGIEGVTDAKTREAAAMAFAAALQRNGITLAPATARWVLVANLRGRQGEGASRATWELSLKRPDGSVAFTGSQSGTVGRDATVTALSALAQSTVDANATALVTSLRTSPSLAAANVGQ